MNPLCLVTLDATCMEAHAGARRGQIRHGVLWSEFAQAAFTVYDADEKWWPTEQECREAWEATP